MYESLTKYIQKLDNTNYGQIIIDNENDGTLEHPLVFPFVSYDRIVLDLVDDIYAFVNDHPEYELHRYNDILAMNGIDWSNKSMEEADVASLDGKAVMALLVGMLRADRFCEGAMFGFLKSGKVKEWLLRLKEIDMQYQDEK